MLADWSIAQEWQIPGHGWQLATLRGAGGTLRLDAPLRERPKVYDEPSLAGFDKLRFACQLMSVLAWKRGVTARAPGPCEFRTEAALSTIRARWLDGNRADATITVAFGPDGVRLEVSGETVYTRASADVLGGVIAAVRRVERLLVVWNDNNVTFGDGVLDDSIESPLLCAERWTSGVPGEGPPPVTVRLNHPQELVEPSANYNWRCGYRIQGVVDGPIHPQGGLDPVEALMVAARELSMVWHRFPRPRVRLLVPPPSGIRWSRLGDHCRSEGQVGL
ncbi:MAG: hypothetical protein ABMB14_37825, partial [Myxococcota bacterium]